MTGGEDLNERARAATTKLDSLWHVDDGQALFVGPLHRNALHRHCVPVYLAGLYGTFRLRIARDGWLSCRTAVIPARVPYEFDMGGEPLAVFYLEPNVASVDALTNLVRDTREINGALVGSHGEISLLRWIYEDRTRRRSIDLELKDLINFSSQKARILDPRVFRAVEYMQRSSGEPTSVPQVASFVGLSSSRFQHVFTREVGVPFRRYRSWHRLRTAVREIVSGKSFTSAAHAAGFADQAHFSREFRRTFGAPPSRSL
ncbi:MAG: AraC family transcriptional regulator [Alphaproteobacteria bacterium]|nr:AraC family transcriptional regulator [Alphaproteobacteria bacterium]